jgi:hypothetical protein
MTAILSSCRYTTRDENAKKTKSNSKIRNGIVITSKGINVKQAFLLFDDGGLVPEDNIVKVNQKVWLRLVTSGWKEKDSTIFLSARETVETSEGVILLDDKDLFKDFENGFSLEEAQFISLSVVITELKKLEDYFKVSFKIKDEINTRNTVEGYYKLYLY